MRKAPSVKLCCGMFAAECRKAAPEFPDVEREEVPIDSFAMKLVMKPQHCDAVVTTRQFGGILTDWRRSFDAAPGISRKHREARKAGERR